MSGSGGMGNGGFGITKVGRDGEKFGAVNYLPGIRLSALNLE